MTNGVLELAKMFKECENGEKYNPTFGVLTSLNDLVVTVGDKIRLGSSNIKSLINLYETDIYGKYVHLGKTVALLPYSDERGRYGNKYIVLGVIFDG